MTLRRLKWLSVLAPALVIGLFEFVRHTYFHEKGEFFWINLATVLIVAGGAYIFARFIFRNVAQLQRDIWQRNLELTALSSIVQAAGRSLSLEEVLKSTTDKILEVLPAEGGGVLLAQSDSLVLSYQRGLPDGFVSPVVDLKAASLRGVDAACRDAAKGAAFTFTQGPPGNQGIFLPLNAKDVVLGVLCLVRQRPFGWREVELLSTISQEIGFALENARLHSQVQEMAVLEERDRIAREVHDGLAQVLGYMALKSATVQQLLAAQEKAKAEAELKEMERVAQEAYADAREAILGLRTSVSPDGGLVRSLTEYVSKFQRASGLRVELDMEPGRAFVFSPAVEVQLIRIVQEALTNVRKHAGASHAWVRFRLEEGEAWITVEDDGRGFDASSISQREGQHFGLQTMKERAERVGGRFRVDSAPGRGTRVEVILPLHKEREAKVEAYEGASGR